MIINDNRALAVGPVLVQHGERLTMSQQFSGGLLDCAAVKVFCKGTQILASSKVGKLLQCLFTHIAALALQLGNNQVDLISKLLIGGCYLQPLHQIFKTGRRVGSNWLHVADILQGFIHTHRIINLKVSFADSGTQSGGTA